MMIHRFAAVGMLSTVLNYLFMIVLLTFLNRPLAAAVSYCCSFLIGYYLHVVYTLQPQIKNSRAKKRVPAMTLLVNLVIELAMPHFWGKMVWLCPLIPRIVNFISVRFLATNSAWLRVRY